jgi:LmbE family N-acetylglucosaminyl deacetylase
MVTVARSLDGTGPDERRWRSWQAPAGWPLLPPDPASPLVVAPHPDDEILGAAGLLARAARTGAPAEVVAVTDGEASHPDSVVVTRERLAAIRRRETDEALRRLGAAGRPVHRLGHPDGAVDEDALTVALAGLLHPGRRCVATWRHDGHPDHEAVGRAAARACAATGAVLIEYPVWTWHWAEPADPRVPWAAARALVLTPDERERKRAAIAAFVSQIAPLGPAPADAAILPSHVLARFDRPVEVFFVGAP